MEAEAIDRESVYNRIKAIFSTHGIFHTPEAIEPYIRHIERLARNRQPFHPSAGDILIRLEDSEKFIKSPELKAIIDNIITDRKATKTERQTEYDIFLNRFVRAFTMSPYNMDYLKAIPHASMAIIFPEDQQKGINKSLIKHNFTDESIEKIKKVVKEFIEVSDKYNVNVRKWIKPAYQ